MLVYLSPKDAEDGRHGSIKKTSELQVLNAFFPVQVKMDVSYTKRQTVKFIKIKFF